MARVMGRLMRSANTTKRGRAYEKFSGSVTIRFSRDSNNMVHTASVNWLLDGQKTLAVGPDGKRRSVLHCHMEREATVRKQPEACSERARPNCTHDKERMLLRSCQDDQRFVPVRWAGKYSSNLTEPSDSPKTVSRKTLEMEHLVRLIFVLVGMDRIVILVGLFKVGGPPMNSLIFLQGVSLTGNGDSLVSDERCKQCTFHTRKLFSRVAQAHKLHRFVCDVSKNNHPRARFIFRTLPDPVFFSPTLSTPTSSSLLFPRTGQSPVPLRKDSCWVVLAEQSLLRESGRIKDFWFVMTLFAERNTACRTLSSSFLFF